MRKYFIAAIIAASVNVIFNDVSYAQNITSDCNQCSQATIPNKLKVLALSRTSLCDNTAKVGDDFCAKLIENVCIEKQILIPSGSIVYGKVKKVNAPKRFINRDGFILISICEIQTPQGQRISLAGNEVDGKIISPYTKSTKVRVAQQVPIRVAAYGTSIPLSSATNLNGGVIYAIATGASMAAGAVTGFLTPDYGLSRTQTSAKRALEASPVGTAYGVITKGNEAQIGCGDGIIFNFEKASIKRIQQQYVAQMHQQKQTTASASN